MCAAAGNMNALSMPCSFINARRGLVAERLFLVPEVLDERLALLVAEVLERIEAGEQHPGTRTRSRFLRLLRFLAASGPR
jgi:hypothetical protein